jgi:hypothetical protein
MLYVKSFYIFIRNIKLFFISFYILIIRDTMGWLRL